MFQQSCFVGMVLLSFTTRQTFPTMMRFPSFLTNAEIPNFPKNGVIFHFYSTADSSANANFSNNVDHSDNVDLSNNDDISVVVNARNVGNVCIIGKVYTFCIVHIINILEIALSMKCQHSWHCWKSQHSELLALSKMSVYKVSIVRKS